MKTVSELHESCGKYATAKFTRPAQPGTESSNNSTCTQHTLPFENYTHSSEHIIIIKQKQ